MKNFIYRLVFTKGDDIDLSQLFLWSFNIFFMFWITLVSVQRWVLSEPLLDAFLVVYATTVVLSSPTWLVKLWLENMAWFRKGPLPAVTTSTDVREIRTDPLPPSPVVLPPNNEIG